MDNNCRNHHPFSIFVLVVEVKVPAHQEVVRGWISTGKNAAGCIETQAGVLARYSVHKVLHRKLNQ